MSGLGLEDRLTRPSTPNHQRPKPIEAKQGTQKDKLMANTRHATQKTCGKYTHVTTVYVYITVYMHVCVRMHTDTDVGNGNYAAHK